jgi:hypothetical protein
MATKKKTTPPTSVTKDETPPKGLGFSIKEENFYASCTELFPHVLNWFVYPKLIACGHDFADKDVEVYSYTPQKPSFFDLQNSVEHVPFFYDPLEKKVIRKKNNKCYGVVIHKALPQHLLNQRDSFYRNDKNLTTYGETHYLFLNSFLGLLENQFDAFTQVLNGFKEQENVKTTNYLKITTQNINWLISVLEEEHEGYSGIFLPDVQFEVTKQGKLHYTNLMFSKETSSHFCMAFTKLLRTKLVNLEESITITDGDKIDEYLNQMPHFNTKEKMKLVLKILNLKDEPSTVTWGIGELIMLFQAMQQMEVIQKDLDKTKMAVAFKILTGKSELNFLNSYVDLDNEAFDLHKIFGLKKHENPEYAKQNLKRMFKKFHKILDETVEKNLIKVPAGILGVFPEACFSLKLNCGR